MADYPLRSATDRCLGGPLPHQPANQTQVHPSPINLWRISHVAPPRYQVLIPVSRGYPCVRGRLPTRYSPVRRYPRLLSTEVSIRRFPLDLHVLGTPPAFILSQDQTLNEWYVKHFCLSSCLSWTHFERLAFFFALRNYCCLGIVQGIIFLNHFHDCVQVFEENLISSFDLFLHYVVFKVRVPQGAEHLRLYASDTPLSTTF